MARYWPIALIVLVFGSLGLVNAFKPSIGQSEDAKAVQAKLTSLPTTLGDWTSVTESIPEKQLVIAEAQANMRRVYTHPKLRASVNVMILYGAPGPLGAHTPETCYEGAGFKQVGSPMTKSVSGKPADFWSCNFETGDVIPTTVNVNWAWGVDGAWKASDNPRFDFAAHSTIYKLYVTRVVPAKAGPNDKNPIDEFLPQFLEQLQNHLKSTASLPAESQK
ncbi:MAG: exosortase-associated EpsI family protein [Fimbriiglobus sp.]